MASAEPAQGAVGTNALGLDAEMFTGKDVARSQESMVSKHLEKMQAEKENLAIEKLKALMPKLGAPTLIAALKETVFDVETAVSMLRRFNTDNEDALKGLHKRRHRLVQHIEEAAEEASDGEPSSSSSDSGSDRKRRHSKSSKHSKHRKRSGKDRKRRKDKGSSKATVKSAALTSGENFGKYGIIRETDAAAVSSEFILWALEVRKVDVETLPRNEERELFRDFIEDYNTGTLPHKKYYNLESYNKYKEAKAAAKGLKRAEKKAKTAVDDEAELRRQRAEEAAKLREQRMKEALAELKYSDKAKDMKEQEMLRLQMQNAYKTGDKALAERLMARLAPDDPSKPK